MRKVFVEGHRGYCAKYPENTLLSFEAAIDLGVDCFEFDVRLSKDGEAVIMHDGNARRTCGVDKALCDMTLAEIKSELEPAYVEKFGSEFVGGGLTVPTLEEVCRLVDDRRRGMPLGVEIKDYTEECVDVTVAILKRYGLFDNAWFYAFDLPTIKRLKTLYNGRTMGYPDFQMKRWEEGGYGYYDEIGLSMNLVRSEVFPIFASKGLPMHHYCADNEADVRLCIEKGAALITANDPVPLMKVLGRL
ncbi:MAG: hypothetical protein IKM04_00180 [Clostridia bacterium]|nr:hypothetical protein [Clostridia bacterium]